MVVPTYNRAESLAACLSALAAQDQPRDGFEVIVVDDGSRKPPRGLVARFESAMQIRLIEQRNAGPAAARNAGAAAARAPFLAFTDDDCCPTPEWLTALGVELSARPHCAVGGPVVSSLTNPCAVASQLLVDFLYQYFDHHDSHGRFFVTANVAMPTDLFQSIGGFDQTFPFAAAEDRDFCERWQERGHGLASTEAAIVLHAHPLALQSFCRQHFTYGRGAWFLSRANRSRGRQGAKVQSIDFYSSLLSFPFSRYPWPRNLEFAALLVLSQVAYKVGFLWQWTQPQRGGRTTRAQHVAGSQLTAQPRDERLQTLPEAGLDSVSTRMPSGDEVLVQADTGGGTVSSRRGSKAQ